jgi:hypothetical protein
MELRAWVATDLDNLRTRLERSILSVIPAERLHETVDGGGNSAVSVMWHVARHHDLSINAVLRGAPEVLDRFGSAVGITTDTWRGLSEAEDAALASQLDGTAVAEYLLATIDETVRWWPSADVAGLETIPDTDAVLSSIGTPTDRFDWLYGMWSGKPASWFIQWQAVGHGVTHLGELTDLRNRMGLSPF